MPGKSLAVEGGLRLHGLEGGTEITPSWRLEVIGSKGRTVVEERYGAMSVLERTAWQLHEEDSCVLGCLRASRTSDPLSSPYDKLISVPVCCCM